MVFNLNCQRSLQIIFLNASIVSYNIILQVQFNNWIRLIVSFKQKTSNYVSEATNCLTNSNSICDQLFVWYWLQIILILWYDLYLNTKVLFAYTIFNLWKTKYLFISCVNMLHKWIKIKLYNKYLIIDLIFTIVAILVFTKSLVIYRCSQ